MHPAKIVSNRRDGKAFHDFDGLAWECHEMGMVLEKPGRRLVRLGLNDSETGHVVPDIRDAGARNALP
jgi:hypothetical protein